MLDVDQIKVEIANLDILDIVAMDAIMDEIPNSVISGYFDRYFIRSGSAPPKGEICSICADRYEVQIMIDSGNSFCGHCGCKLSHV